jgi:tRNA nucleotidyltransferase (CCA-adding enzyme)
VDLWGGLADLQAGLLRVLHARSFEDDPTRILRILRFAGRFGFEIEPDTLDWLKAGLPYLEQVSGKRIRTELDYALKENERVVILEQMDALGVLGAIHPGLRFDGEAARTLGELKGSDAALGMVAWLMQLEQGAQAAERLRLEAGLLKAIQTAQVLQPDLAALAEGQPSVAVARLEQAPELARQALWAASERAEVRELLERYAASWQTVQPKTDGHTLSELGLPPGPRYKEILWRLRAAWLDDEVRTVDEEEALLKELLGGNA